VWAFGVVLWEIFSMGATPYINVANSQLMQQLEAGMRLEAPPGCSDAVHRAMSACWEASPSNRPVCMDVCGVSAMTERGLQTFNSLSSLIRGLLHDSQDEKCMLRSSTCGQCGLMHCSDGQELPAVRPLERCTGAA
jgi:hypothetical protein